MDLVKTGELIVNARKSIGLTPKELGAELGVTDKAISKWERGLCFPDVSLLKKIRIILGIPLNDVIYEEGNNTN